MGSLFTLMLLMFLSLQLSGLDAKARPEGPVSSPVLDLAIRDYAIRSYDKFTRTGVSHSVLLPANLSGINVDTARFRCGSLARYGARVGGFRFDIGLDVRPCVERVIIVAQELDLESSWSSIYSSLPEFTGYQLITPVLGLLAYRGDRRVDPASPLEIEILAEKNHPIIIDFSNITKVRISAGVVPFCATFDDHGKVTLDNQKGKNVCVTTRKGHFGLVIESPEPAQLRKRVSKGKAVTVISIGAALGTALIALLLVAMCVKVKKKNRLEEMERRAYEEEALQVTMVGHVRAPVAPVTRTTPTIEHYYTPPLRRPP